MLIEARFLVRWKNKLYTRNQSPELHRSRHFGRTLIKMKWRHVWRHILTSSEHLNDKRYKKVAMTTFSWFLILSWMPFISSKSVHRWTRYWHDVKNDVRGRGQIKIAKIEKIKKAHLYLHIFHLPLKCLGCIYGTSGETGEDILGRRKRIIIIIIIIRIWKKQSNNRRVYRLCRSTLIIHRNGLCSQYKAKRGT